MSSTHYIFDMQRNETNARNKRELGRHSHRGMRCLRLALVFILFSLILEIIYYFVLLPIISDAKIIFNLKEASITEAEAVAMTGIEKGSRWASLDSSEIANSLMSYPIVESAVVNKKFPDKVFVEIITRRPVAVSFVKIDGVTVPLEIDKEGVVFRMGWNKNTSFLTIVSGLNFQNPKVGMRMNYQLEPFFKRLGIIARTRPLLLTNISEIKIREKKYGDYDLILYPTHKKVVVLANKGLNEKTLNRMMLVLDTIGNMLSLEIINEKFPLKELDYIDIRGENIVYKWKEKS